MSLNYGGIAIVTVADVVVAPTVIPPATTFEADSVWVTTGAIYRPSTEAVCDLFLEELEELLETMAINRYPVFVVGDVNIRLDRSNNLRTHSLTVTVVQHSVQLAGWDVRLPLRIAAHCKPQPTLLLLQMLLMMQPACTVASLPPPAVSDQASRFLDGSG